MHAKWTLDLYKYLCCQNEIFCNGLRAASVTEVAESANTALERIENSFSEQYIWTILYVIFSLPRFYQFFLASFLSQKSEF